MRLQKGFTLAEILIVLMVIGIISTMTVPSLMGGVTQQQYKTAYKKAYSQIANIAAMDKASDSLSTTQNAEAQKRIFSSLNGNLSVKSYCPISSKCGDVGTATLYSASNFTNGRPSNNSVDSWLNTEDGMSYRVLSTGTANTACNDKATIMNQTKPADTISKSCTVVVVDVNGLSKGPNLIEPQVTAAAGIASNTNMNALTGDRFYIFVGTDGATGGSEVYSVGGRIVTDAK